MVRTPSSGMPGEQPQAGGARTGADLDDVARLHGGGEKRSGGTGSGAHGAGVAELHAAPARGLDDLRLGHELLGVGPAGRLELAHGATLRPGAPDVRADTGSQRSFRKTGNNSGRQTRIDG